MTKIRPTLQYVEIDNKNVRRKILTLSMYLSSEFCLFERCIYFLSRLIQPRAKAIYVVFKTACVVNLDGVSEENIFPPPTS